jgi:hypothetical protein
MFDAKNPMHTNAKHKSFQHLDKISYIYIYIFSIWTILHAENDLSKHQQLSNSILSISEGRFWPFVGQPLGEIDRLIVENVLSFID